jgi:hypothetical protein
MENLLDTFDQLRAQKASVEMLCRSHLYALNLFHPSTDLSKIRRERVEVFAFSYLMPDRNVGAMPNVENGKIGIASTVTCIKSLFQCPEFRPISNADFSSLIAGLMSRLEEGRLNTSELSHGNPFTVGLLLPLLKCIPTITPDSPLVRECIAFAREAASSGGVAIPTFPPNGYLTYWILKALEEWGVNIRREAEAALSWSQTEFYRQVSLFGSDTDEESDAFQLGYNLLIQYKYKRDELRHSVVELGLDTLFRAQLSRGIWEKKDPLFVYGRNGDAYCYSFELLTALLSEFLARDDVEVLAKHQDRLKRALECAVRNANRNEEFPVWRSGQRVDDKRPESWATAEIYLFLQLYRSFLSQRIQHLLLNHFKGLSKLRPEPNAFSDYYFPSIVLPKEDKTEQFDVLLKERVLEPLRVPTAGGREYSLVHNLEPKRRIRSGILFGPPGTGKTTFVKAIARYLGWPLITLDPSDFAKEGMHLVANATSKIFDLLFELEDTVIFFDEMEELIRERAGEAGSFEQKFLTTSLLPKLQHLYDRAGCIFLVATNHFEAIDKAARREGRFDFQIQIVPPCFDEKMRMVADRWKPSVPQNVIHEMNISSVREKITLATRMEMLALIDKLMRDPGNARSILESFAPVLVEEDNKNRYFAESAFNLFNAAL